MSQIFSKKYLEVTASEVKKGLMNEAVEVIRHNTYRIIWEKNVKRARTSVSLVALPSNAKRRETRKVKAEIYQLLKDTQKGG